MLFSIALMVICALVLSEILQKLKLPGLVGMLLTGIVLGPYVLNFSTKTVNCCSYNTKTKHPGNK